jgi:hypothetical protein
MSDRGGVMLRFCEIFTWVSPLPNSVIEVNRKELPDKLGLQTLVIDKKRELEAD